MAKRRKLNRRVVVLLVVVGIVIVALAGVYALNHLHKDADAYFRRGEEAYNSGDLTAAIGYYHEAVTNSGKKPKPEYCYRLAKALMEYIRAPNLSDTERRNIFQNVIKLLRTSTREDPNFVGAHRMLCDIYWKQAKDPRSGDRLWKEYVYELDSLIQVTPDDHHAYFQRGQANFRLYSLFNDPHQFAAARADFEKAIELKPDEVAYWAQLFTVLQQASLTDDLANAHERSVQLNPKSAELRASYAGFLQITGQGEQAKDMIQQAIKCQPANPVGYMALSMYYRGLLPPDLDGAIKALQDAIKVDDTDYRPYNNLAMLYGQQGQFDKAIDTLRTGLRVVAARLSGNASTAPASCASTEAAGEVTPEDRQRLQDAHRDLSFLLASMLLGRLDDRHKDAAYEAAITEANTCREDLMHLPPGHPSLAKVDGMIAYAQGHIAESVNLLEQSMEGFEKISGHDEQVFDQITETASFLLKAYLRQGRPGKATETLEKLLQLPGRQNNPQILLYLAQIRMAIHDYSGAVKPIKDVLTANPSNAEAKKLQVILQILQGQLNVLVPGMTLSPEYAKLILNHAVEDFSTEHPDASIRLVEQLHEQNPQSTEIVRSLADMYCLTGQQNKADDMLAKVEAKNPELTDEIDLDRQISRETDPAKRLEKMLQKADKVEDPLQRALTKANICQSMGQVQLLYQQLQEAAKIEPNSPVVIDRLFNFAMATRQMPLVKEWAARAAETNADGVGGRIYQAKIAVAVHDNPQAIDLLNEAIQHSPESIQARCLLGDCYFAVGDMDGATHAYEEVLANNPTYIPAVIGMAQVTAPDRQGNDSEHASFVQRAYQFPEGKDNAYINREYIKIQEQNAKPADLPGIIAKREQLFAQSPKDMDNAVHLGVLYEKNKQFKKAEETFQYFFDNFDNKIAAAGVLAGFYTRQGRTSEVTRVLTNVRNTVNDKVAAWILTARFMEVYGFDAAYKAIKDGIEADPKDPRGYFAAAGFLGAHQKWNDAAEAMQKYLDIRHDDMGAEKTRIRYLIEAAQYEQAAATIEQFFGKEPIDIEALALKGLLLLHQHKLDEAKKCLDLALLQNPRYPNALLARAQVFLAKGDPQQAKTDLAAIRQISNEPLIGMEYAAVCNRLGQYDEAKLAYLDILSRQKSYAPAAIALSQLCLKLRDWESLEARLGEFRTVFPNDPAYLIIEFQMWKARHEKDKALKALELSIVLSAERPEVLSGYLLGLLELGLPERCVADFKKYYKPDMGNWLKCFPACALVKLHKTDEADGLFLQAISDKDTGAQKALICRQISDAYGPHLGAERLQSFIQAKCAGDWQINMILGAMYSEARDYSQAIASLQKTQKLPGTTADQNATVGVLMGLAFYGDHKYSDAEKHYLEVLKINSDEVQALNNLAYMYANDLNEPNEALPLAKRATELVPGSPNILDTYGWVLAKLGRYDEAEQVFDRVLAFGQPLPIYYYHLGYVYEQTARLQDAMKQYRRGLEIEPDNPDETVRTLLHAGAERVRVKLAPETQP